MDLTLESAYELDAGDALWRQRARFLRPGDDVIYLAGNSLGLQPRGARALLDHRLREWGEAAVLAWHDSDWMEVEDAVAASMARIVGARPHEVAVTGTLTVNLHLLMASFYRPAGTRTAILMEPDAFPSDQYAAAGQAAWHGLTPSEHVLTAEAGTDEGLIEALDRFGDRIALVLLSGVNYYTGRVFDMQRVTEHARAAGCLVGLDLAHAAGNVPLYLHDWDVDFAAWCGYKYLNGGPGAPAALFVHERHHTADLPRLAGWWGHDPASRFQMPDRFLPARGASGWQVSTPSVLALAPLQASMAMFDEVGMPALLEKSRKLTGFLSELIVHKSPAVEIITPQARGAQLSLKVPGGRATFDALRALGVVCDWREPDVIRVAPTPFYNGFAEMVRFVDRLERALSEAGRP
ncbi:MAG: kynureninase [Rhodothermales bacterium]|nr:kynureninase [Rhodothermales bacterium]MBO6780571.1 kynureninase [Rhodothermales bacterium]